MTNYHDNGVFANCVDSDQMSHYVYMGLHNLACTKELLKKKR